MTDTPARPRPKAGILDITAYVGGKATAEGFAEPMKLSSNENALGCSPLASQAYAAIADKLHLYPDGHCKALREAIAQKFGLEPDRLIFTAGSDEIFDLLSQTYLEPGDNAVQGAGRGCVDALDERVGVLGAHEGRVQHSRQLEVVDKAALAEQQGRVFLALDAGAEEFHAHQAVSDSLARIFPAASRPASTIAS